MRDRGGSWNGPEFSFLGDELVYAFPSDDRVTCLAISINLELFDAFRARPEAMFSRRIQACGRRSAVRFRESREPDPRVGSQREAIVRRSSGPGWALVGDAAMSQDPWTGVGMDNAGVHATMLAEAIDGWLGGPAPERDALEEYRRRRDEHAMPGFEFTAEAGRDLSRA